MVFITIKKYKCIIIIIIQIHLILNYKLLNIKNINELKTIKIENINQYINIKKFKDLF